MQLTVQGKPAYAYTGGKPWEGDGRCVVFIHGALHDHSVWTLLARWAANQGYRVLAPDLPAHGRSAGPALGSVEALGDWVLAALTAAGLAPAAPVAYVGHSLGSLIALEATAQAPTRAAQLVMLSTAYPMAVSAALLALVAEHPQQAIAMVNSLSISTWAAKPSFPGPGQWLHGSNRALMRRVLAGAHAASDAPNLFHHDFSLCDRYVNGLIAAAQVRCPTTLVLGRSDQMTPPRQARELAAALSARVVTLEAGSWQNELLNQQRRDLPARCRRQREPGGAAASGARRADRANGLGDSTPQQAVAETLPGAGTGPGPTAS